MLNTWLMVRRNLLYSSSDNSRVAQNWFLSFVHLTNLWTSMIEKHRSVNKYHQINVRFPNIRLSTMMHLPNDCNPSLHNELGNIGTYLYLPQ